MPTPNYTIDKLKQHFTVTINELLPTQSGNSGKFLTTNGETISWATVDALPSQTGQSGKFLTTNGTTATWETVDALPSQTNNSGKYLTTNGSSASWGSISYTNLTDKPDLTLKANVADLANVATSGDYDDLTNKPTIPTVPTNVSSFTNDSGYITGVSWDDISDKPSTFTPAEHNHDSDYADINHNHDGVYAPLASPALTGTPTAPTATAGDNSTQIATTAYVDSAVSGLVDSAPTTLDTLNELAAALGDDPNFATTVATSIGEKLDSNSANYVKSLSISGTTITVTKGDNTTSTLTTQDTTYSLPEATTSTLGGVIVGAGLSVSSGTISADDQLPSQTGNSGKYLTTNGTTTSWSTVDALPSQTGNNGKYLTTNGSIASWVNINEYTLPIASSSTLGGIKVGANLSIDSETGVLNATDTVYTHPTTSGNKHIPSGGSTGQFLKWSADGTATWAADNDTTYSAGDGLSLTSTTFSLDTATASTIGGVKIGSGITITDGVISADSQIPTQTNNGGKYLTTDGSALSWATVDALPSQTNNSGKFLTTNGTTASWATIFSGEVRVSSTHHPTAAATTIVLTTVQVPENNVEQWGLSVYRDGIYLIDGVDYTYASNSRTLTFTRAFEANEVVSVNFAYLSSDGGTSGSTTLPTQTGQSGKFLTTNGTDASWSTLPIATTSVLGAIKVGTNLSINSTTGVLSATDQLPTQTNNSGKFLTTNGTTASWATVDALPSQTGNSGKVLSTNGTTASWITDAFSSWDKDYDDLTNKPTIPVVPTTVSSFTNDAGYITGVAWNDVTNKPSFATVATSGDYDDLINKPTIPTIPTNVSSFTNDAGYITGVTWNDVTNKPSFFSGNYNDLTNKPTIPTVPTNVSAFTNDSGYITGVSWDDVTDKPSVFTPDTHNHDGVYAPLASPALTGTPTAPTATAGNNSTQIATTAYVDTAVSNLVNSAPTTLDTLAELSAALGDDPNFATTVATNIGNKLSTNSSGYIKSLSISGKTITYTKGDNTTGTLTTQDTTYTQGTGITISNGVISADNQLPTQTNNSGKFLTTNGTTASWATVDALPSQSGNSGKYLTTNGSAASWATIESYTLPTASDSTLGGIKVGTNLSIDGNGVLSATDTVYTHPTTSGNKHIPSGGSSGQVLVWSSDGTATWGNASDSALPSQTGNSGKYLTTNGTSASWSTIASYTLPTAAANTLGGIKVGTNLSIDANGVLSATDTTYSVFGKSGSTASTGLVPKPSTTAGTTKYLREDGTWTVPPNDDTIYTLPKATTSTLGGVIVGSGLSVNNGTISANNQLPSQTSNSGKFLTTNGTTASWATVDALPTQTNNTGKFLKTNGTTASWEDVLDTEIKISSIHYPAANATTITLTAAESIPTDLNKYALSVYRNGIYMLPSIDYGFNSTTRVLTFTEAFDSDEVVAVLFTYLSSDTQATINLDVDEYEAGTGITFTENPITNKVTISADSFPTQTGNSGKYLTTNGSTVSWGTVESYELPTASSSTLGGIKVGNNLSINNSTGVLSADNQLPSQSGNSGKFLTTNGSAASWATVDALPSQTGNSGKFLTTNGTTASWAALPVVETLTTSEVEDIFDTAIGLSNS